MPDFTTKAIAILDRMISIVEADMLVHGVYLWPTITRPDLAEAGAICGGHKACAIGSLWLAGDVPMEGPSWDRQLPSVLPWERQGLLGVRPDLRVAYDALDTAAMERIRELPKYDQPVPRDLHQAGALETLFEGLTGDGSGWLIDNDQLVEVINRAKSILRESVAA